MGEGTWHCVLSPKPCWPSADVPGRCPGSEPPWGYRGSPGTRAGSTQPIPLAWAQAEPASPSLGDQSWDQPLVSPWRGAGVHSCPGTGQSMAPIPGGTEKVLGLQWPELIALRNCLICSTVLPKQPLRAFLRPGGHHGGEDGHVGLPVPAGRRGVGGPREPGCLLRPTPAGCREGGCYAGCEPAWAGGCCGQWEPCLRGEWGDSAGGQGCPQCRPLCCWQPRPALGQRLARGLPRGCPC